jgi:hypothetical protein
MRLASSWDAIVLSSPRNVPISVFLDMYHQGNRALQQFPGLTPEFLLRGFTGLRYHNYSEALASLWICVEQLTSLKWSREFIGQNDRHPQALKGRMDSLRDDNRTWSAAVRQELLMQIGSIDADTFAAIFPARKARNNLAHSGQVPDRDVVLRLFDGVLRLLKSMAGTKSLGIDNLTIREDELRGLLPKGRFDEWEAASARFA